MKKAIALSETEQRDLDDALFLHVRDGNLSEVRKAVKAGANLKATLYLSPILNVAFMRVKPSKRLINYLLDKGADINAVDYDSRSALHWAALRGSHAIIEVLIERGANLLAQNKLQMTPLEATQTFSGADQKTINLLINAENKAKTKKELGVLKTVAGIDQKEEIVLPHAKTL